MDCARTTILVNTPEEQFFGFIPRHGRTLNGYLQIRGSIWDRQRTLRSMQSLEKALDDGLVTIISLPNAPCPVETSSTADSSTADEYEGSEGSVSPDSLEEDLEHWFDME
mgnify:CR=1 FL=1